MTFEVSNGLKSTNDWNRIEQKTVLGWFWEGFWKGLGGFEGYKNMIEKNLRKRRVGDPGIDICSWALPI